MKFDRDRTKPSRSSKIFKFFKKKKYIRNHPDILIPIPLIPKKFASIEEIICNDEFAKDKYIDPKDIKTKGSKKIRRLSKKKKKKEAYILTPNCTGYHTSIICDNTIDIAD